MSVFKSQFSESPYQTMPVYYTAFSDDAPELTSEFELIVNQQMEFLYVDNSLTYLKV